MADRSVLDDQAQKALGLATAQGQLGSLQGKQVVLTGTMSLARNDMYRLIRAAGGEPSDRVTADTDLVVATNPNGTSTKLRSAERYGVRVVNEAEFVEMLTA